MDRQVEKPQTFINLLRPIGYGLLLLVVFDAIAILIPPKFFSPTWEFNTIGNLVNRVPLILLGFGTIFYGSHEAKTKKDKIVWQFWRWLTLIVATLFLLMAPLLVVNSFRIKNQTDTQVTTEVTQQLTRLNQLENQVKAGSSLDVKNSILQINPQLDLNNKTPDEIKIQLLKEIASSKQNARQTVEQKWQANRLELTKNTVKWFMGTIVAATLLFWIWRFTA
ncbi:HpsJ-like protein, cyanoexosortase A-associated [Merismopedia glauca]|uniref:Uncharacterized protein n=1 Tax=Merismopedia glauca CCAP 1448/3 TaxID=1296344 RepID=A0A2T1C5V5_9CYAN|nr:HpsJ family protein [Merismopedia glauca]PSB03513.1 hypothetical protein C7B64_08095 [Merismopedia glauca CCAP 1448/3]